MKYSGIDLHSNNAVVAVIDDDDRVLYCKRLTNDLALIVTALMPWRDELQGVVVESTFNWYWLVDGLMAAGFAVHLANTAAIKQYEGLKYSGDERDAVFLATFSGLDYCPKATSIRRANVRCATWHASACSLYSNAPCTS
jgi:transposase